MASRNSDLLPPLFDQVLADSGHADVGGHVREDIIRTLEAGIVNAAAAREREEAARTVPRTPTRQPGDAVSLHTSDRLSGEDLSRTALLELLQRQTGVGADVLEMALLLIEAQIDLRLKGAHSFSIAGLTFSPGEAKVTAADTAWCTSVLQGAVRAAAEDKPSAWDRFTKRRAPGIRVLVETLQLSAAQRDALPYTITVDAARIEPLLEAPRASESIRILHVSDLHLVGELREEGRLLAKPLGAPTHSFTAARLMSNAVRDLSPAYDLLVATGDLTTDGASDSFETVLQYVQSGSITGANPMRIAAYGLGAPKSRRILLPGNHDRYDGELIVGQQLSGRFEEMLDTPKGYPYAVGFRPHTQSPYGLTLILFVFDSTLPEGRENNSPGGWARAAAVGKIGPEELQRFNELAAQVARAGKVDQLAGEPIGFSPANTVRIALLHHHPLIKHIKQKTVTRQGFFKDTVEIVHDYKDEREAHLMQMEGGDDFMRACIKSGVQLALFGHQHLTYRRAAILNEGDPIDTPFGRRPGVLRNFCCPTTLQHDAKGNGFYVYDVVDRQQLVWSLKGSMREKDLPMGPARDLQSGTIELDAALSAAERETVYSMFERV